MDDLKAKEVTLFWKVATDLRRAWRAADTRELALLVDEIRTFVDYSEQQSLRLRGMALLHNIGRL